MEKNYEVMLVIAPDLKDDQIASVKNQIIDDMVSNGAEIEKTEDWGKRDLAYEIKNFHQGYYHLVQFKAPPMLPDHLKSRLKVNEKVIRYMITLRDTRPVPVWVPKGTVKTVAPTPPPAPKVTPRVEPAPALAPAPAPVEAVPATIPDEKIAGSMETE